MNLWRRQDSTKLNKIEREEKSISQTIWERGNFVQNRKDNLLFAPWWHHFPISPSFLVLKRGNQAAWIYHLPWPAKNCSPKFSHKFVCVKWPKNVQPTTLQPRKQIIRTLYVELKYCVSNVATEICFSKRELADAPTSQSDVTCHVNPLDKKNALRKNHSKIRSCITYSVPNHFYGR
jgi:hypothetical protein